MNVSASQQMMKQGNQSPVVLVPTTAKSSVLLPPLAHHGRRRCRRHKRSAFVKATSSISTESTSYLSSDSETDTTMSTITSPGVRKTRRIPKSMAKSWDVRGQIVEASPLQYSDDEEGSDDDSLEFLDQLLTESSDRWKNDTVQIVSKTITARGPCGHMLSALNCPNLNSE